MLSAQEKQWVAGYRDFVEDPRQVDAHLLKGVCRVGQCVGIVRMHASECAALVFESFAPLQEESSATSVPIAMQFPRHSASLQYLDENTVMSPIERVQQIKDLWSKTHAAVMADRAQRLSYSGPNATPRTPSPKATTKAYTDERTPEFKEAIELASSKGDEMDEVAASLLLECWVRTA